MKRFKVSDRRGAARGFARQSGRGKAINFRPGFMRGGIRL